MQRNPFFCLMYSTLCFPSSATAGHVNPNSRRSDGGNVQDGGYWSTSNSYYAIVRQRQQTVKPNFRLSGSSNIVSFFDINSHGNQLLDVERRYALMLVTQHVLLIRGMPFFTAPPHKDSSASSGQSWPRGKLLATSWTGMVGPLYIGPPSKDIYS